MYGNVNACEVQDGRQDGQHCDTGVGNAGILCHQECCCAHDRRHDLSAGGGCCLNSACKLRFITGPDHHRDGHGAGGHGVSYGRTGNHTAQRRGDDCYLSRTAAGRTCHTVCQINEERRDTGSLQKRAKNDEYYNILLTHIDRSVHHTVGGVEQIINDLAKTDICKGVNEQCAYHKKDRKTDTAAAKLHQNQNSHDCQRKHKRVFGNDAVAG